MQAGRPWSVEPNDGWDDSAKWYPSVRAATEGWSAEDTAAYTALQERARELSAFVITHGSGARSPPPTAPKRAPS